MSVSKLVVATALIVSLVGGVVLMLPSDQLPPYPRPRPDIQVWDASLPPPEGMQ